MKIFVGMSGGVDSTASLKILHDQGHEVEGLTFVGLGETGSRKCCSVEEIGDAKRVCSALGVGHRVLDLKELFKARVRNPFVQSYLNGETPNPCMLCNRFAKFGALVEYAVGEGAEAVAMGHYSGVECHDGEYFFRTGKDKAKDQSYFLAMIEPDLLPYLMFPLADKTKAEIREIVAESGLPIRSDKSESQDICFVPDDYRDYLRSEGIPETKGAMIMDGKPVGNHSGVAFYALGQRRGIGAYGQKTYVRGIDAQHNTIVLGEKPRSKRFLVDGMNVFSQKFGDGLWLVQTRYRSSRGTATISNFNGLSCSVELDEAQDIVSPGQYAVFYKNELVYAAGRITKTELL
ncbi:MAG: tRNA 2-thiouridine(34) synthase MnmA [Brevinema sp.]